ncbi:hypothetical protein RRF57_009898 [Xylaria bambusicola]|uniref:Uncharacterized protein n=1 Tax=Xylaria bambusicola TaxID=326684 RepID=A0AAN7V038_9PEZI
MSLAAIWTQFFPPRNGAPLTGANLPPQHGKVFIVTGVSSGIGYELARILYGAGGRVYMLTRSKENADAATARIKAWYLESDNDGPVRSRGSIEFIHMDLMDLNSVKRASRDFLFREKRLDVLLNMLERVHERMHHYQRKDMNTTSLSTP